MSVPGADNRDDGADFHVGKQPLGIGHAHANATMGRRGHSERRGKGDFSGFSDPVRDSVKADVATFATFGESGHEAHPLIWVRCVERLGRFRKDLEGASWRRVEKAG